MRSRLLASIGVIAVSAVAMTGCAAPASESGPVTLEFWSWAPDTQKIVDIWNEEHPDIQVNYTDAGGGDESAAKLLTASRAGNAPDLAAVEYTTLPSLIVADVQLDITESVADVQDAYTEGTWQQTTFDGSVFGLPQDVGPMALVYRSDKLEEFGIPVPTTWAEFRDAAAAVRAADPNAYIASIPPGELGFYAGVATQAGSEWWSVSGSEWTVGIADEASLEVADFFDQLAKDDLILTDPLLTPEYNKMLNEGTILSWPSALWAPGVIESVAPDTAGSWAMAPLPQWTPGDSAVAYQGGSAVIVTKQSKHAEAAVEFAKWLNASDEGAELVLSEQNAYPAAISGQEAAASNEPPTLMPQQTDFYEIAAEISSDTIPVTWGPNVSLAKTTFTDALSKAIQDGTPWRDAFIATQDAVVEDMTTTGFEVTNR